MTANTKQAPKRKRHPALKPPKAQLRKGDCFTAIVQLKSQRSNLLRKLKNANFEGEKKSITEELALVNDQLSLAYEVAGNQKMADKHSIEAIEHYAGPNHLGFAIALRNDGVRMLGRGKLVEAEQLIEQALRKIPTLRPGGEHLPQERIDTEYWVTQSEFGRVLIANGDKKKGLALMRAADAFLKDHGVCSKRFREFDNLVGMIPHVGPVERRLLALRAIKLNEQHVHNPQKRLWLTFVVLGGTPAASIVRLFLR